MNFKPLHVLLADDDKDDCLLFKDALEELLLSATLATVNDGEQLMQFLLKISDNFPDVLFLDLNMPRKNGFQCLSEIKSNPKLKALPVIIFSTSFNDTMAEELYQKGAHYYICKPVDFTGLKKVIHHVLSLIEKKQLSQPPKENFILSNLKMILF